MSEIFVLNNRVNSANWQVPIKLDLGCGEYLKEGFVGMDWHDYGQDIVFDARKGIPLPNNWVSELFTSHFLEHLSPESYHFVLTEMFRVSCNGAKWTIKVPHGDTIEGVLPCHYNRLTELHLRAIDQWQKPHYEAKNPNYISPIQLLDVRREDYHLIGEFLIHK